MIIISTSSAQGRKVKVLRKMQSLRESQGILFNFVSFVGLRCLLNNLTFFLIVHPFSQQNPLFLYLSHWSLNMMS